MEKKLVADHIFDFFSKKGIKQAFCLTGGGAMFLNDALAKNKEIITAFSHHEQASAMASVAYTKLTNLPSIVVPTTGCGGTNCITGLLDAWQDNLPCIFISGQVNKEQTTYNSSTKIRQFGVQEANIVEMVQSITKYSVMVNDPNEIFFHLEKAYHLATTGRKGPVWLDIPLDVQNKFVTRENKKYYQPSEIKFSGHQELFKVQDLLNNSSRPIILAGNGIKLSESQIQLAEFIEKHNIPVVTTFLGLDLLPHDHKLNIGRVGIKGNRAANFAMQNSDLIISIGTRLSVPTTGYKYDYFAREAKLVVVDIDSEEHKKDTVKIDLFIEKDAKEFLCCDFEYFTDEAWVEKCIFWKNKWSTRNELEMLESGERDKKISIYDFLESLSDSAPNNGVFISDAGSAYYTTCQSLKIKKGQRHVTPGAQAEMGFTIPAVLGCYFATDDKTTIIGITGDGSFQTNLQELQTIIHYKIPAKIFILNNDGYLSIRTTQRKFFNDRFLGTSKDDGVSFPDTKRIAKAYGYKYIKINKKNHLDQKILKALNSKKPVICEVFCKKWDMIIPTLSSRKNDDGTITSKPLEDMFPFLNREEFYDNMLINPLEE